MGVCPLFSFRGVDADSRACAERRRRPGSNGGRSRRRAATGWRSSTSSSAAKRAAWCCGSRSIGRDRRATAEESVSVDGLRQRVSRDLSALLDVEDDACRTRTRLKSRRPASIGRCATKSDYRRFTGRRAKIVMREAVDGQTFFKGRLGGVDGGAVLIDDDERTAAPGAAWASSRAAIWRLNFENDMSESSATNDRGAGERKGHRAGRRHQRH